MFFAKQHHKKGFTLAETILVVAIIAILLAVAAPNVLAYYRQLKLTGLDDDAKTIFMAAQSRLTAMLSAGEELEPSGTPITSFGTGSYTETPTAAGGAGDPKVDFWYINTDYSDLHNYVPGGSIESQLQNNKFVVEFNPDTGAVYAVWYWESDNDNFTYNPTYFEDDISRDTRLDKMVGYYGGSEVKRPELGQLPIPQLSLINAEELRLEIRIPSIDPTNGYSSTNLNVDVFVNGKAIIKDAQLSDVDVKDPTLQKNNVGKVILDTLKPSGAYTQEPKEDGTGSVWSGGWVAGAKFKDWNSSKSIGAVPGDDINVTVTVKYTAPLADGKQLLAQSASVSTNSLFAGLEGGNTALIAYGRHLQNLHDSNRNTEFCSGVYSNSDITSAKQIRDINFYKTAESDEDPIYYWGSTYKKDGGGTGYDAYEAFHPISNANILKFDGDIFEIRNMCTEDDNGASGLFSSVYNEDNTVSFCNITIVNPNIHGHSADGSAGALASDVFNKTRVIIDNCKVYVDFDEKKDIPDWEARFNNLELDNLEIANNVSGKAHVDLLDGLPHIGAPESGSSAGGLIGTVWADSTVEISDSFSSISVIGETCVGGLVGNVGNGDSINIRNSYSASFLFGKHFLGGFLGHVTTGVNLNLTNSYVAGEIKLDMTGWPVAAGFFTRDDTYNLSMAHVENCYSAVKYDGTTGGINPDHGGQVYGTYRGDDPNDTNYNYYIADPDITAGYGHTNDPSEDDPTDCGNEVSAAELIEKFEADTTNWDVSIAKMVENGTLSATAAAGGDKQTTFTHAYNLLDGMNLQVYPYPMLKTNVEVVNDDGTGTARTDLPVEHYGDWVEGEDTPSATMVYYETTVGGTNVYGFYKDDDGNFKTEPGGLLKVSKDTFVIEDGYALSYPTGTDVNKIPDKIKIDGDEYTINKTSFATAPGGDKLYRIEGLDSVKRDKYYHKVEVPVDNTAGAGVTVFWFNPDLACEVFPDGFKNTTGVAISDTMTTPLKKEGRGAEVGEGVAVVRSARQLAQLGINTSKGNDYAKLLRGLKYEQKMDIDYNVCTDLPEIEGDYNHVPVTLDGGTYNGMKIYNLKPGALVDTDNLVEDGLFGRVKNATISNVTLINAKVVLKSGDNAVQKVESSTSTPTTPTTPTEPNAPKILDIGEMVASGKLTAGYQNKGEKTYNSFTIRWKDATGDKRTNVQELANTWLYKGASAYSGTYAFSFGGTSNTTSGKEANYIKFSTSGPATVKIWWVQISGSKGSGQVKLYKNSVSESNVKGQSAVGTDDKPYLSVFEISESGTYYLGDSLTNGVRFYRVELYSEKVPYSGSDPRPYDSNNSKYPFPEEGSGASGGSIPSGAKVRAGALAGIVEDSTVTNCGVHVDKDSLHSTYHNAYNDFVVRNELASDDAIGGLIGEAKGKDTQISTCHASVQVRGSRTAGGFVGKLSDFSGTTAVNIKDCYVGGHTINGTYLDLVASSDPEDLSASEYYVNVSTAATTNRSRTGGFVGWTDGNAKFGGTCYTTASVGMEYNTFQDTTDKRIISTMGQFSGDGSPVRESNDTLLYASGSTLRKVKNDEKASSKTDDKNGYENFPRGSKSDLKIKVTVDGKEEDRDLYPVRVEELGYTYDSAGTKTIEGYLNQGELALNPDYKATNTQKYDQDNAELGFPYALAGGQTHYGDWTKRFDLIYYEIYDPNYVGENVKQILNAGADVGNAIGFYSALRDPNNTAGRMVNTLKATDSADKDVVVYDSGYMILADNKTDTMLFGISAFYGGKQASGTEMYLTEKDRIDDTSGLIKDQTGKSIADRFFVIPFKAVNLAPSDTYYQHVTINGQPYMINQHFACEAINLGLVSTTSSDGILMIDYDTVRAKPGVPYSHKTLDAEGNVLSGGRTEKITAVDDNSVLIRSPWNLASMARYTREGNESVRRSAARTWTYKLMLDVDYELYNEKNPGRIFDGNTSNRNGLQTEWLAGTDFPYGQVSAFLEKGGKFEGEGHTVSNIYLGSDSGNTQYVGLFGKISGTGTAVRELVLKNAKLNAWSGPSGGIYVGTAVAEIAGGAKAEDVYVIDPEMDFHNVPTLDKNSGYVLTNKDNGSTDDPGVVFNAVGGAVGHVLNGEINNVYVKGLSISLNSNGKYKYYVNNDPEETIDGTDYKDYKPSVFWREGNPKPTPTYGTDQELTPKSSVKNSSVISIGGAIGEIKASASGDSVSVTNVTVNNPVINGNKGKTIKAGGAIGDIDVSKYTGAKATVDKVYVTDAVIDVSATTGNIVGGVIGRADGKADTATYDAAGRGAITIRDSGVYLNDAVVEDALGNKTDNFNTKYGVLASNSSEVGGFVGRTDNYVTVTNCFSAIRVEGAGNVGGFAGDIEGSVIESCYSGGHTVGGKYETEPDSLTGADPVVNVTGGSGATGGFAGKIENSGSLELKGIIYTTSSVTGTGNVGLFQGGNNNTGSVKNAIKANDTVVYAVGKAVNVAPGKKIDESDYLRTGVSVPGNTNTALVTKQYDPTITEDYPYANSTETSASGTAADTHYGDWEEYSANAAFYWEKEGEEYRFYIVMHDSMNVYSTVNDLCPNKPGDTDRDAKGITEWGYGLFSSDPSATIDTPTGLNKDESDEATKAMGELKSSYGIAKSVLMIKRSNTKTDDVEVTFGDATYYINTAYGAGVSEKEATMGASADEAYQIRTVGQLENMGGAENTMYFQQTHDIVCDSSFNSVTSFGGHFDGGFYRIIDNTKPVFDELKGATVDNVIVYAPEGNKTISGNGGLAASTSGTGVSISNTIVAGFTIKPNSGNVGGLVGSVSNGPLTITNSEATNTLTGKSGSHVGGLVGNVAGGTLTIKKSYAGGYISGSTKVKAAGGLVGNMDSGAAVWYENVYSYVNMMDAKDGSTFYGIGPGEVTNDSDLSDYWFTGLDDKDPKKDPKKTSDTDANIKGVTLAEMKLHTQAMDETDSSVTVEEYLKPDSNRDEGLKNHVTAGMTEADKFGVFPFAAFVTGKDTNYHYGDYPVAEYVGLYYYEKEVIFDAKNPMETNATTGEITNEGEARTEYNYYAYGGEIYNGKLYGQRVLDTLCYDHHLTGEYAYIAESGYGYFYPGEAGAFTIDVKDSENKPVTHNEPQLGADSPIKEHLLEAFEVASGENFNVYKLDTTNKYLAETWTLEPKSGSSITGSIDMKVNTAFGGAISNDMKAAGGLGGDRKDGKLGDGIQIRTMQQLQNLTDNRKVDDDSAINDYEHFEITHDINGRGFENASNPGRGYIPGRPSAKVIEGNGYRIFDLNISVDKDHLSSDTVSDRSKDAALFTSLKFDSNDTSSSAPSSISGIILYSTTGDATITSSESVAAGIVAEPGKVPVSNCSVVGYTINGATYVGGIVGVMGDKDSSISGCQVASVTLAGGKSGVGGIVGKGRGTITNCYAGGMIKNITDTSAPVGGIYGDAQDPKTDPVVSKSYSYMDLRDPTNKGTKYAIGETNTTEGTNIDNTCYYLDEYATGATTDKQGTGLTFEEMCNRRTDDTTADYVYVPNGTDPIDGITSWGDAYPMAAVVKVGVHAGVDTGVDKTGEVLVHYGEWPYCARAAGIAYWEKDDGEYKIQIVGADFYGNALYKEANTKTLYGDELCEEHHVDTSGKITEHNITDSGYAVFTTNSALAVDATGLPTTEASSDKSGVVAAINKALGGACLSGETKVYSNNDVDTGSVKTATVKHGDTEVAGVTLNYNPGMSGVSYDTFGTSTNPVPIRTVRQLDDIPSNGTSGRNFKQTHDLYGKDYMSGGKAKYTGAENFAGKYNGQSYKILDLSMDGDNDVGLFASVAGGEIKNVVMYSPSGVTINGASSHGGSTGSAGNSHGVGGIAGRFASTENSKITNCVVAGYEITGADYVGGIVGYAYHGGTIANCASVNTIHGSVTENGTTTYANGAGGVVGGGENYGSYAVKIYGCYAGGTIDSCGSGTVVGGVYGNNTYNGSAVTIQNCYVYVNMSDCGIANVYTISGDAKASVTNSYYLDDISRYPAGCELQAAVSYDDLKDNDKWEKLFPAITDVTDPVTDPGKATSSYVTKNQRAGTVEKSDDGYTPMEHQTTTANFPFPEMVQDVSDPSKPGYVHYGEWPVKNTTTPPNKNPGKIGVFMGFNDSSGGTFGSNSDAVAYMFDEYGMRYRLGTSNKGTTCSYLGLVIGGVEPTNSGLNGLQVIYFADGVEYDSGNLKGTVTSCYNFATSATTATVTPQNSAQFGNYKLYPVLSETIKTDKGAVVIALDANVSGTGAKTIDANNVVGWFKLKELNDTKGKALYTDPNIPKGASLSGVMSAAVPEGLMPEASALPENELAGEAVAEGETEEILPPDTPEEVTPEASMLPENELAGEPVEEGETEEILPPDTPDAIKPEEFTLPEPENTDDNGDDGHTEIIDIRVSVARVRRVR